MRCAHQIRTNKRKLYVKKICSKIVRQLNKTSLRDTKLKAFIYKGI